MIFFQGVPVVIASMRWHPSSKSGTLAGTWSVSSYVIGDGERGRVSLLLTSDRAIRRVSVTISAGNDLGPVTTNQSSSTSGTNPVRDIVSRVACHGSL